MAELDELPSPPPTHRPSVVGQRRGPYKPVLPVGVAGGLWHCAVHRWHAVWLSGWPSVADIAVHVARCCHKVDKGHKGLMPLIIDTQYTKTTCIESTPTHTLYRRGCSSSFMHC